jgi:two-component system, cell cycle sensor histidine kinase and response regulator CckA
LLNLVVNARDAMPDGGALTFATENVALTAEEIASETLDVSPGDYVRIAVIDTGGGIPPDVLSRVYEPFFTTKETGNGVGLGLAVVYGIVSRHGGRIDLVSRPGAGTVFTVHLRPEPPASVEQGGKP